MTKKYIRHDPTEVRRVGKYSVRRIEGGFMIREHFPADKHNRAAHTDLLGTGTRYKHDAVRQALDWKRREEGRPRFAAAKRRAAATAEYHKGALQHHSDITRRKLEIKNLTTNAKSATEQANRTSKPEDHTRAASYHKELHEYHKSVGNKDLAKYHKDQAEYHRRSNVNSTIVKTFNDRGGITPKQPKVDANLGTAAGTAQSRARAGRSGKVGGVTHTVEAHHYHEEKRARSIANKASDAARGAESRAGLNGHKRADLHEKAAVSNRYAAETARAAGNHHGADFHEHQAKIHTQKAAHFRTSPEHRADTPKTHSQGPGKPRVAVPGSQPKTIGGTPLHQPGLNKAGATSHPGLHAQLKSQAAEAKPSLPAHSVAAKAHDAAAAHALSQRDMAKYDHHRTTAEHHREMARHHSALIQKLRKNKEGHGQKHGPGGRFVNT